MEKEKFAEIMDNNILLGIHLLSNTIEDAKKNLAYPDHNWWGDDCYPVLGSYEYEGKLYDLGFFYDREMNEVSAHIAHGNDESHYLSGRRFWGSDGHYRKLAGILNSVRILDDQTLIDQYAMWTNWKKFYNEEQK